MVGLLGSLHCIGMCGVLVFACTLSTPNGGSPEEPPSIHTLRFSPWVLQVVFHLGRLLTYGIMGAVTSGFFSAIQLIRAVNRWMPHVTVVCGLAMVFLAATMMRWVPLPSLTDRLLSAPLGAVVSRAPALIRTPNPGNRFLLGLLTGLLPCCLSWSMVVTVVPEADPLKGFVTMILFGLGTVPALMAAALFGIGISTVARRAIESLAALAVGGIGITLVLRGFGIIE